MIDYTTITSCGECCIGCAKMCADVRNNNQIETILGSWNLDHPQIGEQFQKESDRLVFKIKTDSQDFILKGIPCGVPETTVESNVRAHLFLGNENGMAPKLYPTKTGTYYVSNQSHWFYLMEFSDKMCAGSVAAAVLMKRGNIYKGMLTI